MAWKEYLKEILKNLKGFLKHFFLIVLYTCSREHHKYKRKEEVL